jgi:hypothetical protein
VSSFLASRRLSARPLALGNGGFPSKAAYIIKVFAATARPAVCYQPVKSVGHSPSNFGATSGVFSNYAIKGTSVHTLHSSLTSGASSPYFGC